MAREGGLGIGMPSYVPAGWKCALRERVACLGIGFGGNVWDHVATDRVGGVGVRLDGVGTVGPQPAGTSEHSPDHLG